jgi:hypothetical protein
MSVRVNLLPREVEVQARQRRSATFTVVGVLLFVVLLGVAYFLKLGAVEQARQDRDAAQAEVTRLRAEVAQLEEFRILADKLDARNQILMFAMGNEISWARTLNDLSLTFPANASLRSLTATATDARLTRQETPGSLDFGEAIAQLIYQGYSVERFAPGVEVVLLEFDNVRAFFNAFLTTAQVEEIGSTEVTAFNGSVRLNEEAHTNRYENGLPEEAAQ